MSCRCSCSSNHLTNPLAVIEAGFQLVVEIGPSSSTCVCTLAMSAALQMLPVAKALVCNHKPLQLHGLVVCANLSGS